MLLVPYIIFVFFGSCVPYNKDDHYWKQFEKDFILFIVKELVPPSFVEVPFFRRLVQNQNIWFNKKFNLIFCLKMPKGPRKGLYLQRLIHVMLALYLFIFWC
jgi:hypothetical protein